VAKIKGFAEWLPEQQILQQKIVTSIRDTFELYGFTPLQTRSIELISDLTDQGETDKEIYGVHRLTDESEVNFDWGLHYDLTVPFARYVSENRGKILFPYRRYQIQQAWRGERPQLGRFREFIQADADVVAEGELDLRYDAEILLMFQKLLFDLPIPKVQLQVNNRKLLQGFYEGQGIAEVIPVLRAIDKMPKIGEGGVEEILTGLNLSKQQIENCIGITKVSANGSTGLKQLSDFSIDNLQFSEGIEELGRVLDQVNELADQDSVVAGLHIARGFDYYTGTVAETIFPDYEQVGSICSGGRYDNLISAGSKPIPGVGFSIGVSRLLAYCFHLEILEASKKSTAEVFVAVNSEQDRNNSNKVAAALRSRGIATLVSDSSAAFGKQIKIAEKMGIKYVWFLNEGSSDEIKDLEARSQTECDVDTWMPKTDI